MKLFFDTSVLVAVAVSQHPNHSAAFAVFRQALGSRNEGVVAAHGLAETYSTLTRLPLTPMIRPTEALLFLNESVVGHCEIVGLNARECISMIDSAAKTGIRGGALYDALQLRCAEKAGCDRIYTFNTGDFVRLAPDLRKKVLRP